MTKAEPGKRATKRPKVGDAGMHFESYDTLMTVTPNYTQPSDGVHWYRWAMHFPLPFALPSRKCVQFTTPIAGRNFDFGIHGHFDQITVGHPPVVQLCQKTAQLPADMKPVRDHLLAVATFCELTEYETLGEVFSGSSEKLNGCLQFLADYLSRFQSLAPLACSWLVYPLTPFDFNSLFHSAIRINRGANTRGFVASWPAFSAGSHTKPLFFMTPPGPNDAPPPILVTPYELLAEGVFSIARGLPRLGVLNSYNAFELLANNVFGKCKTDFLVSHGMPSHLAEKTVEDERQRHKTDVRFLVHDGLNDFMSRSLLTENKLLYDDIIKVQKLRHQVAHAGEKPSTERARAALRKCCEAVGWLGQVVGVEVKPFLPEPEDVAKKFEFVA